MHQKRVASNYIFNLVNQLIIVSIPIVTTPYIARVLGADGVGLHSYTYSIVSYFILFASLGSGAYAQREIAFRRNDRTQVSSIFVETLLFRIITTLIAIVVYLCFIFKEPEIDKTICMLQGLHIIVVITDISWFFQGLEEFKKVILRNIAVKILNLLYVFVFIRSHEDLYLFIGGYAVFTLVGNVSLWVYLKQFVFIEKKMFKINPFRNIKVNLELFIPNVAIHIYTVMDKTMLGFYSTGTYENGYYEQSEKIVNACLTIITSLGTVMAPRIAYVYANKEERRLKEYLYKSYKFVWFLGIPICFGIFALSDMIVPWFLGSGYQKCELLIKIFAPLVIIIGISNVTGMQYLVPTKKQNILSLTVSIGAVINILINFFLIPKMYSIGAAIASIVAESVITIIQIIFVVMIDRNLELKYILKPVIWYIPSGFIMMGCIIVLKQYISKTFFGTLLLSVIGAFIYMLIMFVLKDEICLKFFAILQRKIKSFCNL